MGTAVRMVTAVQLLDVDMSYSKSMKLFWCPSTWTQFFHL